MHGLDILIKFQVKIYIYQYMDGPIAQKSNVQKEKTTTLKNNFSISHVSKCLLAYHRKVFKEHCERPWS